MQTTLSFLRHPKPGETLEAPTAPPAGSRFGNYTGVSKLALISLAPFAALLWIATDLEPHYVGFTLSLTPLVAWAASVLCIEHDTRAAFARQVTRIEVELRRRMRGYDPAASVISSAYFVERLRQEIRRSQRYQLPMTLIVLKIAPRAGDDWSEEAALAGVSADVVSTTARLLRTEDVLGYVGDLEYAFCLPHTAAPGAEIVMGRLAKALIAYVPNLGLAQFGSDTPNGETLLDAAREDAKRRSLGSMTNRTWNEDIALN